MRSASSQMIAHLGQEVTTLAWCWKATRRDAQVFGFTTHDRDLLIGGVTYRANSGMTASAAQSRSGTSVDNQEIQGFLSGPDVTEADIRAGLWDACEITAYLVNWQDVTQIMTLHSGHLGNLSMRGSIFVAELLGLSAALQNTVGRTCTRRCDANLGDARCGVNLATWTVSGTVSGVTDNQAFSATNLPASPGGLITWTSGLNTGRSMEVAAANAGTLTLMLPMEFPVSVGDTYSVSAGCDKNLTTCRDTFSNTLNFRGFPHLPGPDKVLAYPTSTL